MSIKGFHLVFVTVSTLLCLFLAVWSFVLAQEVSSLTKAIGCVGIAGMVGMPIYGIYFYRKASKILV
ncbi:MAG: hypothetical protein QM680_11345 [Luteolibacter sp.]